MTKDKLTEIMYLFRDLWCQNIDLSTIDEFIDDLAEREVKLFATPEVGKRSELLVCCANCKGQTPKGCANIICKNYSDFVPVH